MESSAMHIDVRSDPYEGINGEGSKTGDSEGGNPTFPQSCQANSHQLAGMPIILDTDESAVESNNIIESNHDRLGFDKTISLYLYRPDISVPVKINNEADNNIINYIAPQKRKFKFSDIRASVPIPSFHT
jgi:hypothetical protein